ncbi:MAG: pilus assembly protein PilM [Planctomycetota bacterium]|jgi:type IV pilus assembly protein PilM|nr:pilus assembly protein PilM [Planctomycetota bacterium]
MAKRHKKNTIVGLDLGTSSVKLVELTCKAENLTMAACAYIPVEDPSLYDIAIKAAIKTATTKAKRVVVGFSGKSTLLQDITLPNGHDDNLDEAVAEEVAKYIPYDVSEAQIDYHAFEDGDNQTRLLLAAVRQQDVDDKLEILFNAGVTPIQIDVELVALANAAETANIGEEFFPEGKGVGIVNFGASKTLITITDGKYSVFREFPVGGIALTEMISQRVGCAMTAAEQIKLVPGDKMDLVKDAIYPGLEDIAAEIQSCLDSYKNASRGRKAEKLLLSGGLIAFPGIVALFTRMTKTEASVFNSFGPAIISKGAEGVMEAHGHEMAVAFGLACHARD